MSIKVLNLNKLLKLCSLSEKGLVSAVRSELRAERDKLDGDEAGGGDFHGPFWSDAKMHVTGAVNLVGQTLIRIDNHKGRKRLYPLLAKGFLDWFDQLRRTTNERVGWLPERVHNHHEIPELGVTIKVDNLLGIQMGRDKHRLVYPYFSEKPILSDKWARIGLWVMSEALSGYSVANMELLDVLRARSFSGSLMFFRGDEDTLLSTRYFEITAVWNELRHEYGF